jgi:AAA domain
MSLLQPAKITSAYLKMGILGFQGGGKTKTAGKTAIGLYKYMQSKGIDCANKPVAFFDTETGSDWLIPDFQQAGVPLVVAKRRSFADLLAVVKEAEAGASVLIIDSITHPWRELCESYMRKKQRTFLQMDDWGYLKGEHGWAKFTDLFVNSKLHIIMCGRAGYEFEDYKDDNGKRQIEKVGTKMKTEGETGFEPSLLVLMEQVEDLRTGKVKHRATVQKDRSTLLDGEQIDNPDFKDFLPHIERLNLGGDHMGVDINGTANTS